MHYLTQKLAGKPLECIIKYMNPLLLVTLATTLCIAPPALALERALSIGSGISTPADTTALEENVAGLAQVFRPQIVGTFTSESDHLNPFGAGAFVFFGNGMTGAALGLRHNNETANPTFFDAGAATTIPQINFALGFKVSNEISAGGWGMNLGGLYNPYGTVRVGATAYEVFDGVHALGLGISADAGSAATFSLDATSTPRLKGFIVKPGFGVRIEEFSLAGGYGIALEKTGAYQIREGFSLGLGIKFDSRFALEGYYNQLAKTYVGLVVSI